MEHDVVGIQHDALVGSAWVVGILRVPTLINQPVNDLAYLNTEWLHPDVAELDFPQSSNYLFKLCPVFSFRGPRSIDPFHVRAQMVPGTIEAVQHGEAVDVLAPYDLPVRG